MDFLKPGTLVKLKHKFDFEVLNSKDNTLNHFIISDGFFIFLKYSLIRKSFFVEETERELFLYGILNGFFVKTLFSVPEIFINSNNFEIIMRLEDCV